MKNLILVAVCFGVLIILSPGKSYAATCGNGITYTSTGNPRLTGGPLVSTPYGNKYDDSVRLKDILTQCTGKIIFDEPEYYIQDTLPVFSARLLEGSGSSSLLLSNSGAYPANYSLVPSAKIIQMANKPIFEIGTNIYDVSIRDMALIGGITDSDKTVGDEISNLFGIYAVGGTSNTCTPNSKPPEVGNCSSLGFQFSNLKFELLRKGIYVNGINDGFWQFDNVRLDHSRFINCTIGVHINSFNSGWNISSLDFLIPEGLPQDDDEKLDESIEGKTYGIYLERSTYTSMDLLIGNGPSSTGPALATALIYVKEHGNLSIQNTVAEGFHEDLIIYGNSRNFPINVMNNIFMNGVKIKDATIYSSSNSYAAFNDLDGAPAIAYGSTQIYSMGDKFCAEGTTATCNEARGYTLNDTARNIFMTTQNGSRTQVPFFIAKDIYTSADPNVNLFTAAPALSLIAPNQANGALLRMGRGNFFYDVTRSESDGTLTFTPNDNQAGYGYTFNNRGGNFHITGGNLTFGSYPQPSPSPNLPTGTITIGQTTFANLGASANGTLWYCSDCQQTASCNSGGSGAIAKRIAGNWNCS